MSQTLTFPPEVWTIIASYLPPTEIFRLRTLDWTFYNLALEAKYTSFHVDWLTLDTELSKLVRVATDTDVAKRVREWVIRVEALRGDFTSLKNLARKTPLTLGTRLRSLIRGMFESLYLFQMRPSTFDVIPSSAALQLLLESITHADKLRRCTFDLDPFPSSQNASFYSDFHLKCLRKLWPMLKHRIRSLHLRYFIPHATKTLAHIFDDLSQLTEISLDFQVAYTWDNDSTLAVARFLNGSSNIEVLSLFARQVGVQPTDQFFNDLGRFASLRQVTIDFQMGDDRCSSLARFLNAHPGIEELRLCHEIPRLVVLASLCLPRLRKIFLSFDEHSDWRFRPSSDTPRSFPSLTDLIIPSPAMGHSHLSHLCEIIGVAPQMNHLSISLTSVTGKSLNLLAETFPSLQILHIHLCLQDGTSSHSFWRTFKRDLSSFSVVWNLRSLDLTGPAGLDSRRLTQLVVVAVEEARGRG